MRYISVAALSCMVLLTPVAPQQADNRHADSRLNATLWVQTSLEYDVSATQAYSLAAVRLEQAISDRSWTAALEQKGHYGALPPAVILDVDETVLDNSAFQARLIRDRAQFDSDRWSDWVAEAKAWVVPGAREFITHARDKGVAVFFVTNRKADGERATVQNLTSGLGFKVTEAQVLCRNEHPDWTSDKIARRKFVARTHRILLLVGDDFNDFAYLGDVSPGERERLGARYREFWGHRWIQLPNPQYGNWERALYNHDHSLPHEKKQELRYQGLRYN